MLVLKIRCGKRLRVSDVTDSCRLEPVVVVITGEFSTVPWAEPSAVISAVISDVSFSMSVSDSELSAVAARLLRRNEARNSAYLRSGHSDGETAVGSTIRDLSPGMGPSVSERAESLFPARSRLNDSLPSGDADPVISMSRFSSESDAARKFFRLSSLFLLSRKAGSMWDDDL